MDVTLYPNGPALEAFDGMLRALEFPGGGTRKPDTMHIWDSRVHGDKRIPGLPALSWFLADLIGSESESTKPGPNVEQEVY